MDVVFEGALSKSWGMADLLHTIIGVENMPLGILRISSPGANVSGKLAISDGRFIIGASLSDSQESGYSAVKRLLAVRDGNFAFLDASGELPVSFDESLYISIEKLIPSLAALPDQPAGLFDEKSLLDHVFGKDNPIAGERAQMQADARGAEDAAALRTSGAHVAAAPPVVAWNMVEPLITSGKQEALPGEFDVDLLDTAEHKEALIRLRSSGKIDESKSPWHKSILGQCFSSNFTVVWVVVLLIVLIVLLVATLFGTGVLIGQQWLTM